MKVKVVLLYIILIKKTSGALQKTLFQFSLSAIYLNYFSQGRG